MPTGERPFVYLGRSRLHRWRANVVQTLQTVSALERLNIAVELYLPPWPRSCDRDRRLREIGVNGRIDLHSAWLLHPRFDFWPFVLTHRRRLRRAAHVYTRVPDISVALTLLGIPHHLEVHDFQMLVARKWLHRLMAAHRRGVLRTLIPISRSAAARLVQAGAVAERVHVAPSGVDTAAFADITPFDPQRLDEPTIVHTGRLSEDRGLKVIAAFAGQPHCHVITVGGGAALAGIEAHDPVPHAQVPAWYSRCDVALLPYQPTIGTALSMSPMKLFESLASGRPIIASDLPTLREVLQHEHNALLVAPDDMRAWLDALERLRRDRDLAKRLAAQAKQDARQYDWLERARGITQAIAL